MGNRSFTRNEIERYDFLADSDLSDHEIDQAREYYLSKHRYLSAVHILYMQNLYRGIAWLIFVVTLIIVLYGYLSGNFFNLFLTGIFSFVSVSIYYSSRLNSGEFKARTSDDFIDKEYVLTVKRYIFKKYNNRFGLVNAVKILFNRESHFDSEDDFPQTEAIHGEDYFDISQDYDETHVYRLNELERYDFLRNSELTQDVVEATRQEKIEKTQFFRAIDMLYVKNCHRSLFRTLVVLFFCISLGGYFLEEYFFFIFGITLCVASFSPFLSAGINSYSTREYMEDHRIDKDYALRVKTYILERNSSMFDSRNVVKFIFGRGFSFHYDDHDFPKPE